MMSLLESYLRYKLAYKNPLSIMFNSYNHKRNIKVVLKNGEKRIWDHHVVYNYSVCNLFKEANVESYFNNNIDYFTFKYKDIQVKLQGVREGNGDILDVFLNEEYKFLKPHNEIIIDVGANIGDSAIYFAINGAKEVIALEPYPYSYDYAQKNVNLNNFSKVITLLNAGYGDDSVLRVDKNKVTYGGSNLTRSKLELGKSINLMTIKTLLESYNLDSNIILKMDCEGCEYAILKENENTLRRLKRVQIEYHNGPLKLADKLRRSGFQVDYSKPQKVYNEDFSNHIMYVGYIYAKRI